MRERIRDSLISEEAMLFRFYKRVTAVEFEMNKIIEVDVVKALLWSSACRRGRRSNIADLINHVCSTCR